MNKEELLKNLLEYLQNEPPEVRGEGQSDFTPEENLVKTIVEENLRHYSIHPPENVFEELKARSIQKNPRTSKQTSRKIRFIFRPMIFVPALAASVLVLLLFTSLWKPGNIRKEQELALSTIGSEFKSISKGALVEKTGIKISTVKDGLMAFEAKSNRNNIILKDGSWSIETDHNRLEKETWFHFPGGGLKPMGTKFSIRIGGHNSSVELTEGKIQTYTLDKNGNVEASEIQSAPFQHQFNIPVKNPLPVSTENIVNSANSLIESSRKEPSKVLRREDSIYRHFIGSQITVASKEGLKITGILEEVSDGKLHLRIGNTMQILEEDRVTLMGIEDKSEDLNQKSLFKNP